MGIEYENFAPIMHQVRHFFKLTKNVAKDMNQYYSDNFCLARHIMKSSDCLGLRQVEDLFAGVRFDHDTCGGKVSSGQATMECGWLWRKGGTRIDSDLGCWTSEPMTGVAGLVACLG